MGKLIEYIKLWWNRCWATNPVDKYPPRDDNQKKYREEFNIVDKYLIYYESKRDEAHPNEYHRIVYIDAENDVDWQVDGENDLTAEMEERRQYAIAKLDMAHTLPVQNLSEKEIMAYKKLLGVGYNLALSNNFEDVDMAINEAKQYRTDRNKEKSRWLLLSAASLFLFIIVLLYIVLIHCAKEHPHFELFSGVVMGAVGAYVSIWSRYGKLDMTGLGSKALHYLEAISRMLIGAIFAFIIIMAQKSGIVFSEWANGEHAIHLYMVLGFFAGFSEQFVPSVLQSLMHQSE